MSEQLPTPDPPYVDEPSQLQLRQAAITRLYAKRGLQAHAVTFLLVNVMLIAIWAIAGGGMFWPLFPILGWSIALAINAVGVYSVGPREDRIQAEIRRMQGRT
jgi:fatty acid desaturase